jgi:hypothetical protein
MRLQHLLFVAIGLTVIGDSACAQDTSSVITLRFPPREARAYRRHLVALDPFKFIGMAHVFFQYALDDHLAVGGALQTPTGILEGSGIGIQPEITLNLNRDPFRGPYIGATGWINYITYSPKSTNEFGNPVVGPEVSELFVSAGPVLGYYFEGPVEGAISQVVLGAEYVAKPGTGNAAGIGTDRVRWQVYFSGRLGIRW